MKTQLVVLVVMAGLLASPVAVAQYDDESGECADARDAAQAAASELATYARRLEICADDADVDDDCSAEFRRVESAQDDYESAVADVTSHCS